MMTNSIDLAACVKIDRRRKRRRINRLRVYGKWLSLFPMELATELELKIVASLAHVSDGCVGTPK